MNDIDFKTDFIEEIDYIISKTKSNLIILDELDNNEYFELSKEEVIEYFKELLVTMKNWKDKLDSGNLSDIVEEYKEIEKKVSELELCLADKDEIFHCEGISYSLYKIGHLLIQMQIGEKGGKLNE